MGPFEGAGVSLYGLLFFGAIALLIAVFNAGRRAGERRAETSETPRVPAAPPAGYEHFLVCDQCAREADQLLQREGGPQLCEACFKAQPITTDTTSNSTSNSSSRDNHTKGKAGAGG